MEFFEFSTYAKEGSSLTNILDYYNVILTSFNKQFKTTLKFRIINENNGILSHCSSHSILLDDDKGNIGGFKITGQNNCCGAMSSQHMYLNWNYLMFGLSTIMHRLKEDICIGFNKTSIICTDIINSNTIEIKDFRPIRVSNKSLINNEYKLVDTFKNKKSNNIVGYFTRTINYPVKPKTIKIKVNLSKEHYIRIKEFTIGCDPEGFFQDPKTNEFVPSFMIMGGTKDAPVPITKEGHAIQCDNVMFEYNVPPSDNEEDFVKHNLFVQEYLQNKIAKPKDLIINMVASARFDKNNLKDSKALEMGCSPDYNAWTGHVNEISADLIKSTLRTAGGHIAIGYKDFNYNSNKKLVEYLDLFISVPLVLLEPDSERKKLYGKAGAFRNTDFGVEYRVTSNFVFSSEKMIRWVYNAVAKAVEAYNNKVNISHNGIDIINTINNKDKTLAKMLLNTYNKEELNKIKELI